MGNVIADKSLAFAKRIIKLYQFLIGEKKEFIMSKQILRSGTSIGANCREAGRGQSRADFFSKMSIALKEADETDYWLELLLYGGYIDQKLYISFRNDCQELIRILTAITKKQYSDY